MYLTSKKLKKGALNNFKTR